MKKTIMVLLTAAIIFSLVACTRDTQDSIATIKEGASFAGEITVSCFDAMRYEAFLNEAAALFELNYPGAKINIELFSEMPEAKSITIEEAGIKVGLSVAAVPEEQETMDYISRLNTKLMSGQGPDIIAMDVLPYYKYAESGLLEDLRVYMDADESFVSGDYRSNIINGLKYKGAQYVMPLDFRYFFISFDKGKLGETAAHKLREKGKFTYQEMMSLIKDKFAKDGSNNRAICFPDTDALQRAFIVLFESDYKEYVDLENKKAHFTDGGFVQLLNELNEQRANGYFAPTPSSLEESMQDTMESYHLYYYTYDGYMKIKDIYNPDIQDSDYYPVPDADEIAGLMSNSAGEAVFSYLQAYGMNANSKNKALAWAFIKFMLSEEMQMSINLVGEPVNNTIFTERAKIDLLKDVNYTAWIAGDYKSVERTEEQYIRAYEVYLECHNGFIDKLSLCPITDKTIRFMVEKEIAEFFSGNKSAKEVAEVLQNKVSLYLSE